MPAKRQTTSIRIPSHLRRKLTPKELFELARMKRSERRSLSIRGGITADLKVVRKLTDKGFSKKDIKDIFRQWGKSQAYTERIYEIVRKTNLAQGKR